MPFTLSSHIYILSCRACEHQCVLPLLDTTDIDHNRTLDIHIDTDFSAYVCVKFLMLERISRPLRSNKALYLNTYQVCLVKSLQRPICANETSKLITILEATYYCECRRESTLWFGPLLCLRVIWYITQCNDQHSHCNNMSVCH